MRTLRWTLLSALVVTALLGVTAPAEAQFCFTYSPPYPNGCSVPGAPLFVANGLNYLFLGACNSHDFCYATPNPAYGACLGYGTKASCDLLFLAHMEGACAFYAGLLVYPASGWDDAQDFLGDCSAVAGTFYAAVAIGGYGAFQRRQCCNGCNRNMCQAIGQPYPLGCPYPGCGYTPPPPPPPGPGPCGPLFPETVTWMIGPTGDAIVAPEQLKFGLTRNEERPGAHIYMDEWALVPIGTGETGARRASAAGYGARAASAAAASLPENLRAAEVLVVETAVHQRNGREIPTPRVIPFAVDLGRHRGLAGRSLWFRAEVNHSGAVDRFSLLEPVADRWGQIVQKAVSDHLRLRYEDERAHRVVVYGLAKIDERGRLEVADNGLVAIPQCCCGGEFCI